MKIGIIGLGLMGGSLGLALQDTKLASNILGYSRNLTTCEEALELGLVHEIASFEEIKKCDIIFLAIPVEAIISTLKLLEDISPKTTVIDLGSTKEEIIKNVPASIRENFIAAHPMCGTEKFGPSAAFKTLYHDNIVVFCDTKNNSDLHKNRATQIFSHIGMKIVFMDAKEHDEHACFISHLPHAISYALANSVIGQEDPKSILLLAAGGFRDMSRLAKSSPFMWSDIFKQNKKNLISSIDLFEKELKKCKTMIEEDNYEKLEQWMGDATTLHKIL
ncbi:prephenate dehydrogenase [Sulfurospirillum arcachonense]|uniref:prephenate dehydrogenase n=1 Tax=Sulfurospirillum arcachonense TaxID=57666 RepID=UPI00046AEA6E|nr:prephenate dehydrogenase [Sulfurospirillum arcachonense]